MNNCWRDKRPSFIIHKPLPYTNSSLSNINKVNINNKERRDTNKTLLHIKKTPNLLQHQYPTRK